MNTPYLEWLENPAVFKYGQLEAFSDHDYYFKKPNDASIFLTDGWTVSLDGGQAQPVQVPGTLEHQGLLPHQYTNTLYPWDGKEALRPPQVPKRNPKAVYKKTFSKPFGKEQTILTFHGVQTAFYVFLNGKFLGYGEDSFTPKSFDITETLQEENELEVHVFKYSSASWLEDQDMFRFAGIIRPVQLSCWKKGHVIDLDVRPDLQGADGILSWKVKQNEERPIQAQLWEGSQLIWEGTGPCMIPNVKTWSAEKPFLYTLKLLVFDEGNLVETAVVPVGFRTARIEDGLIKINGRRHVFRGVNRHELHPVTGRTISQEQMEQDAALIKSCNIDSVRCCHYPNSDQWYDVCDKIGLYVMEEANMESHGSWQKLMVCDPAWTVPGSLPEWKEAVLDRVKNMYMRHRNHPSVVMWSIGNESYGGTNHIAMHDWLKSQDDRPVHYEGTSWCPEFSAATDIESRMYSKPKEIEEILKQTDKPYLSCEYAHCMGNSLGNMEEYMALEAYPQYQGGFIWDFADQAAPLPDQETRLGYGGDFDDYPNDGCFSGNGIFTALRQSTPKSEALRTLFSRVNMSIHGNQVTIQNQYAELDLSDFVFTAVQTCGLKEVFRQDFSLVLAPGRQRDVMVEWPEAQDLTVRKVRMHKKGKEDSLAEESILMDCRKKAEQEKCARLIEGDGNLSLISDAMHIFINKSKGIVSWKIHGKEMLEGPVRLELFRPLTDNDMGAGYDQTYGIWMEAARFAQLKSVQACQNQVRFLYELPYVGRQVEMELVLAGKTADIRLRLVPIKNGLLPPCFGLRLPLKGKNLPFDWIGRGQADTYADRKQLPYGLYASAAKKEFVPYLRPQECGNHEDTYRLIVPEMTIEASNSPFSFSILPWTSEQIELANHEWELPESEQDVLRILSFMMGVGGDDSWGAPVHDAWLPSKDLPELHFSISANA